MFAAAAGVSLLGAAGCAPGAQDSAASAPTAAATGAQGQQAAEGSYADGTYSADGHYQSPNGTETIGITLTLESGVVTAVEAQTHPSNPNTRRFQGEFASGIAAQVVGRSVDELQVSKVAGSSLTSGGFNDALAQIKAEASR
ncbi:FMN-binding protein [Arthrobacter mobilis]|uniref:FMN-binding domain-containing protein n=1 Tax=Arthrobacter mobilis TaxID=2724944 RepID=A0A7X6K611_9MICC|nr:hypothetical protein [Arthrobacter mobilis]NKX54545.1 hypothetical protein [Arthrobacter mobilis]